MRWLGKWERLLQIMGLLTLGIYVGVRIHGIVLSRAAVEEFESKHSALQKEIVGAGVPTRAPDFGLWSEKRIRDYQESLAAHLSPTIAVLRIPKIQLEVPVLDGTDDVSLNRAVGLIAGTARPEEAGNVGIAGHRDGFFRGLKDVAVGDVIDLETERETRRYVIDRIVIVAPSDVSVLAPRTRPSVTLVTCYPFYFVGSAPRRYIVQASVADAHAPNLKTTVGIEDAGRPDSSK